MPRSALTISPRRRLPVLLFGLVAALLVVAGARITSAGLADYQTRAFLVDWEAKATEPSPRAWTVAHAAATRAVAHYPVPHGAYLERLGYVHAWQHYRQPPGFRSAHASRQAAREAYRIAVQVRPTWPYAWAALAEVKLRLLEFDTEFHHALAQAQRLGPWRANINRRVAEVGLIAWPQLSRMEQHAALTAAARAIKLASHHRSPLFSLGKSTNRLHILCKQLESQGHKVSSKECNSAF